MKLEKMQSPDYITNSVKALQSDLKLEHPPKRIEGFDISNIQGTNPVASMVCFVNGVAKKSEYRRFKIQSKQTPDDFLMMKEAVFRRYSRLLRENKSLPDLILIDGGKGQLNAALQGLHEAGVENMPIAALAKRLDEIFVPGFSDPQNIKRGSAGLHLLQRIRDEAHRFAVTYHRALRKQRTLVSVLEKIPGVGGKRRDLLLKHFGSVKKIKSAPMEEIEKVDGISSELAREIYLFFNPKQ